MAAVDLRMPDLRGIDVLRAIRDTDPDCHVILMTGAATVERDHILRNMESVGGNKMSAARILGIGRRALYRRLERYGIGTIERRRRSKD